MRQGRTTGHLLAAFVKAYRKQALEVSGPLRRIGISIVEGTVQVGESEIVLSRREFELLVFLALRDGPAASELLSEAIWPDSDADRARSSLKVTLSRLRRRLGDSSLILATNNGYFLAVERDIDIGLLLNADQTPLNEVLLTQMHLESARRRFSRWGWAKKFEARIAALEDLPSSTTI